MASVFRKHRYATALLVLAVCVALAVVTVPWKGWFEARLIKMLEKQGLQNVRLTMADVGLTSLTVKDIAVGDARPLTLSNITLTYALSDILKGQLHELTLSGLFLNMQKTANAWTITGLGARSGSSEPSALWLLPVTQDQLAAVPLNRALLNDSIVRIATDQWRLQIPLSLAWDKEPVPALSTASPGLTYAYNNIKVSSGDITLKAVLDPTRQQWSGPWEMKDIKVTGLDTGIPVVRGYGTLTARANHLMMQGQFESADQSYKMAFHLNAPFNAPEKAMLTLIETSMPWNEGTLRAQDVVIPLGRPFAQTINLNLQRISAAALLRQLTGEKASATGTISGVLPVTIGADGAITVHEGKLKADEPGTIALAPDAIPGDNEQVALLRDVLHNFHYSLLSIDVDNAKDNKLAVVMSLEGKNPDMPAGRSVKINVRLTGDVLSFIQQNIQSLTDPKKFLEQGNHANN